MSKLRTIILRRPIAASVIILTALGVAIAEDSAKDKGASMSYGQTKDFLAKHTKVIQLTDGQWARVLVCPDYQGRVMTSSCSGDSGASLGWINREFIEAGQKNRQFNNYGGEERMWLSPEGGPFSLWFAPGAPQELSNWFTPADINDGAFQIAADPSPQVVRMTRAMKVTNAAGTRFDLQVDREVHLLDGVQFGKVFGVEAAGTLNAEKLNWVGFETVNRVTNRGAGMKKEAGLVSIWILSMLNAAPNTVVIVPYQSGDETKLGSVLKSDYFGSVPPDRLRITPEAILFRGDSRYRSKIGTSQKRVHPRAGSIDFDAGVLTLVDFDVPTQPESRLYMNNSWGTPQAHPYVGDVFNSYNDGPPAPGQPQLGAFYEIESLSPAAELTTGQSLQHAHRTFHIHGSPTALAKLAKIVLSVDLESVRREMFGK